MKTGLFSRKNKFPEKGSVKMEKIKEEFVSKNSQEYRLKKIVKSSHISLGIGAVLLVLLILASVMMNQVSDKRLENTMYLNQYRLGSKALTYAVQAYAVTGDRQYYEAYMKELNEDRNRDIAWYGLEQNDIKEREWEALREIASLSNGLVPLEEEAMKAVENGDISSATAFVFGEEYGHTIQKINDLTDRTILEIQNRMVKEKHTILIVQTVLGVAFLLYFIHMIHQNVKTLQFSVHELLTPILKVSEQMIIMSKGNLHTHLDLEADDSEVGQMVAAIDTMKLNLVNIIDEISFILEQMGLGNYNVTISQKYVGEFIQIKDSLLQIVEEMRQTVGTIQGASKELDSGSGQLAKAAEELAISCTSQATQVSDLMLLLDFLEQTITSNEKDAEEAVKISVTSHSVLEIGNTKLHELKETMKSIMDAVMKLSEVVIANGEEALVQIVNAEIEKGIFITEEASADMEDVLVGAEETTGRIDNIVKNLQAELLSIGQIQESITAVAGVVDSNSAISQETAAISEEQKIQAESMVQLLNKFHI